MIMVLTGTASNFFSLNSCGTVLRANARMMAEMVTLYLSVFMRLRGWMFMRSLIRFDATFYPNHAHNYPDPLQTIH